MTPKVVCFGELMLRLSPPGYLRFVQAESYNATYGGAEANVAVSCANYGLDAWFVSKVPQNEIGQGAINSLRKFGVNTSWMVRGGPRLGVYFVEKGAAQRPSKVVYDRANSSIATATPEDFDWPQILSGSSWFHTTGITPALSESAARICQQALCAAKQAGCTTSFDLNFRKNLWSSERANEVLAPMMEYVDICIANEEDAESVFGIKAEQSDVEKGKIDGESYKQVATKMVERFGFKACAITLRESLSASDNGWSALYYDGTQFYESKRYMVHIVDRVGGGDSFAAGLVYSLLNNRHPGKAVEFAVAASCLKHSIEGDYNAVTASEVEKLAQGKASGRVER